MKIEDIAADWCIRVPAKRRQIAQCWGNSLHEKEKERERVRAMHDPSAFFLGGGCCWRAQFRWRHTFEGYTPGTFSDTDDDAAAEDEDTFAKAVKHGAASEQLQESLGKY